jgi:hypothetical protein
MQFHCSGLNCESVMLQSFTPNAMNSGGMHHRDSQPTFPLAIQIKRFKSRLLALLAGANPHRKFNRSTPRLKRGQTRVSVALKSRHRPPLRLANFTI